MPRLRGRTGPRLLLAALLAAASPGPSQAHVILVDGSGSDWRGVTALSSDLGRIARDHSRGGEYVWRDSAGDQRASWPARSHDLRELRVTGDADRLSIEAVLGAPVSTSGDSVVQLQIAIDTDRFTGSGARAFAGDPATQVAPAAAYEYLVQTRFGSGQPPRVLDAYGATVTADARGALGSSGVLECSIPWSALGSPYPPVNPLRLTAALFLASATDQPYAASDTLASRAADVVTQNGTPGATGNTANEVADGVVNYFFDLTFDVRGEVVAPVEISEVYFGGGVKQQWIEIVNSSQDVVPLANWSIGDAETPNNGEAMAHFPSTFLSPGDNFVVARNGTTFFQDHAFHANAECENVDGATPDMLPDAPWASTTQFNIPNSGDQVLLLDGANTVMDVVTFKNAAYPGITPHPGTPALHSLERANPDVDTDDCTADFVDEAAPNPGTTVIPTSGVPFGEPAGGLRWAPPAPNPASGRVALSLRMAAGGPVRIDVLDVSGRRVRRLYDSFAPAGLLQVTWDGRDSDGAQAANGVYVVRAVTSEGAREVRVIQLR